MDPSFLLVPRWDLGCGGCQVRIVLSQNPEIAMIQASALSRKDCGRPNLRQGRPKPARSIAVWTLYDLNASVVGVSSKAFPLEWCTIIAPASLTIIPARYDACKGKAHARNQREGRGSSMVASRLSGRVLQSNDRRRAGKILEQLGVTRATNTVITQHHGSLLSVSVVK